MRKVNILLVEDCDVDAVFFAACLKRAGEIKFVIQRVQTCAQAVAYARPPASELDVVVLDLGLPDSTACETVRRVRRVSELPIVVLSGSDDLELAVQSLGDGVQNFIVKGKCDGRELAITLLGAIEQWRVQQKIRQEIEELEKDNNQLIRTARELSIINASLSDELHRQETFEDASAPAN